MTVRLVDDAGDDVLQGDAGEIWVKGPNVFQGYLDDPEQTARVLTTDGWLRTGDIAVTDDDGYLFLVDRAKDLIIVSGFNVYPAEVEEVIAEHPAVAEVGVAGVPHPHTGEAVKAWVVVRDDMTVDEDTLISWCSDRLARYKSHASLVQDNRPAVLKVSLPIAARICSAASTSSSSGPALITTWKLCSDNCRPASIQFAIGQRLRIQRVPGWKTTNGERSLDQPYSLIPHGKYCRPPI